MGLKSFWLLIILLAFAAGLLRWRSAGSVASRPFVPEFPPSAVLEEEAVAAPAPVSVMSPPAPVLVHDVVPAPPKIHVPVAVEDGIVERAASPRLVRLKDGSLVIDTYWRILSGDGSLENPYRLPWELLLSGQGFDLAAPYAELPDRLKWLNGKHVSLKGYSLKSVTAGASEEFLLNDQLIDNCPICLTRSVFATVLVKVKTSESMERGVINVYTVRGIFKAEPSIQAGFLLGVYFLNDAEITSRSH